MNFVSKNFNVLPFGQAISLLYSGKLPAASACITFDDGYSGIYEYAAPELHKRNMHAVFFVIRDLIGTELPPDEHKAKYDYVTKILVSLLDFNTIKYKITCFFSLKLYLNNV